MNDLIFFVGLIWYTAIIAELAYRNGRRNERKLQ